MTERIREYAPDTNPSYPLDTRIRTPLEIHWRIRLGGMEPLVGGSPSHTPRQADSSYPKAILRLRKPKVDVRKSLRARALSVNAVAAVEGFVERNDGE
jgi:hypothetical protein